MRQLKKAGRIVLCLSLPLFVQAKSSYYTVKKGDTLTGIAKKFHLSVGTLQKLNGLKSPSSLKAGQRLRLRASSGTSAHVVSASSKRHEKKLARALKRFKKKKPVTEVRITKVHKRSLSDIVYGDVLSYDQHSLSPTSQRIIELAKKKLGRRYVWGAAGKHDTFDCSGLTSYVCKMNGIKLPRRAIEQSKVGLFVPRDQLRPGDLVFFDTSKERRGYVNHVGIYIGNGKFIHASSAKKKVIITSLDKPFYKSRYKGARRVVASL